MFVVNDFMAKPAASDERTFGVKFNAPIDIVRATETILSEFTHKELDRQMFRYTKDRRTKDYVRAVYKGYATTRIGGKKAILDKLEIDKVTDSKFSVTVKYRKRVFRPFFLLCVLIGLMCGIIPGLVIYFFWAEGDNANAAWVQPALERFAVMCEGENKGYSLI